MLVDFQLNMRTLHLFQSNSDAIELFQGIRDFARGGNLQFIRGKPSDIDLIRMISDKNVSGRRHFCTGSPQMNLRAEARSGPTITNESRGRETPVRRNQLLLDFIITRNTNTAGD
jgi:hypothetical protein